MQPLVTVLVNSIETSCLVLLKPSPLGSEAIYKGVFCPIQIAPNLDDCIGFYSTNCLVQTNPPDLKTCENENVYNTNS